MASRPIPELIYCADGNARFAKIAIDAGFTYGAQLPRTVYFKPEFCDQDWKNPDRARYMAALTEHKPRLATVLDWERWEQLPEVLAWAEDAAALVSEAVLKIPKVVGGISAIPERIGGKPVRLAYSVPTKFGGSLCLPAEFGDRPVHLLGGSPDTQYKLSRQLNVVSVDGNYHHKLATRFNQYFQPDKSATFAKNKLWPTLREANLGRNFGDGTDKAGAPYEAFRRSCVNIKRMWNKQSPKRHFPCTLELFSV